MLALKARVASGSLAVSSSAPLRPLRCCGAQLRSVACGAATDEPVARRGTLAILAGAIVALNAPSRAYAIQGLTAGRIPGVTKDLDGEGYFLYQRPEGKSGGHGVGWSEIPRYSFKIPPGWEETPVSIADLGGTEIDLRFESREEGTLNVVVAPVLRFLDLGYNANIRIKDIGEPDKIIAGFAPELFGQPLNEGDVISTTTFDRGGVPYYMWELKLKNHFMVTATAVKNRVFIISVQGSTRQWKKHQDHIVAIAESFAVPTA